ncbi:Hsp20/alpha crystallin family protein [Virgibacillus halodenitrificans]|uniref:Hsp20/alpha crystallin family protein n=1 Tax=Virgibacillus halodenitrificans TaxID=1482 RepID=A0ABR7VNU9_VIRHA|nr:Hsp20/alpha crystallin family protein [Virgibacillus halodenitrificans]MBD1223587.1 Hsp20/alpha crystallin family protein [Virgibacillus halodenitrificans]
MDPFQQMGDWKKNMDHFFGDQFWNEFEGIIKPTIPHVNVYKTDHEIFCVVSIPGLEDLHKVDIFVDYSTLELKGTIDIEPISGITVVKEEILQGVFERKVTLPFPVRADKMRATYRNGLIYIQLHRLISESSRKNKVNIELLDED